MGTVKEPDPLTQSSVHLLATSSQSTSTTSIVQSAITHPGAQPVSVEVSTTDVASELTSIMLREQIETMPSSDGLTSEMNEKKTAFTAMDSGELKRITEELFRIHVGDSGSLDWNSGGIRNFTLDVFKQLNLPEPKEH